METQDLFGSDSSIANLFLLQEKYNIELTLHDGILFRYYHGGESRRGWGFPIPLKGNPDFMRRAFDYMQKKSRERGEDASFCLITKEQKERIDRVIESSPCKKRVAWKTNRDDCDYIYLRENLANLPGANYQKKRNHVSRFNRTYGEDWSFRRFPENGVLEDMMAVYQKWYAEHEGDSDTALCLEKGSFKRALENSSLLRLEGGVLYIHGEPCAMCLASPVSDSVLDVIYEKSVLEHEKNGAYAVVNQQFAKTCSSYLYLNREEDMGVEGLRKAKLSYKPTVILDKFYGKLG